MNRNVCMFRYLVLAVAVLSGCSSDKSAETKQAAPPPDKIVGKAQVGVESTGAQDAALNAGGPSVYVWEGTRRYRLFMKSSVEVTGGKQYVVEGYDAQKMIDALGDPDQGKNGYPLAASCEKVVRTAWPGLAFDVTDGHASVLRARIKRFPARPVFVVQKIRLATDADLPAGAAKKDDKAEDDAKEVPVPADKQKAQLIEGPSTLPAPLWAPAGETVKCKLIIGVDGKISELETGLQLCEYVPWAKYSYKPTVQGGKPVKVSTEVEVKFEPLK